MEKVKYRNIKDWFPIKTIKNDSIYLKDGNVLNVFKVEPINFKLKTDMEKCAILECYKQFLKLCNFNMQIIIQTDNINLDNHFLKIDNFKSSDVDLKEMAEDYKNLIKRISKERESIVRKFYIVVHDKTKNVKEKIESTLLNCGNTVSKCSCDEIIKVLKRYFKKTAGARKEARWV